MEVLFKSSIKKLKSDTVTFFVFQDHNLFKTQTNKINKLFDGIITPILKNKDFSGKEDEIVYSYPKGKSQVKRLVLVGLGEARNITSEKYRRASALASKNAKKMKSSSLAIVIPKYNSHLSVVASLIEGAYLALYDYDKHRQKKDDEISIDSITLVSSDKKNKHNIKTIINETKIICDAVYFARDLVNAPGNELYPQTLAESAVASASNAGYNVKVFDEQQISEMNMGGVIGVGKGSTHPPRFLVLEYGKPSRKGPIVLIGKGVTFDSGGISIKSATNMSEMKMDMAGAAAVLGTFNVVGQLKLPIHLIGLIPMVENLPSGSALKPGDIIRQYNGKTTEIVNTDAEGRLILADALAYADQFKPSLVIDLATLTGAVVVALGHHATGMIGNDEKIMRKLKISGEETYERVWQLPIFDEYEKSIKSDIADIKNVGGKWAGTITAALFLKKFIGSYKWIHLDIAGTAMLEESGEYTQRGASGVGVRLLVQFLKKWNRN